MDTRFFISIHGRDGVWISERAGDVLKTNIHANLRQIRVESGFDYHGFNLTGVLLPRFGHPTLMKVEQWLHAGKVPNRASRTRVIISDEPVAANGDTIDFELIVGISEGDKFEWQLAQNEVAAQIRVDPNRRFAKVSASVQDVFQDIMFANDTGIQAVLANYRASGKTTADFLALKAEFARQHMKKPKTDRLIEGFAAEGYASFSSLARSSLSQGMGLADRNLFVDLWTSFFVDRLASHFIELDDAVRIVRSGYFHSARSELTEGSGVNPGARIQHEWISAARLKEHLSDPQIVRKPGPYILCAVTGNTSQAANRLGPLFGWSDSANSKPRKLKLCTPTGYKAMVPLVRDGFVTPFRLFLKPQ